MNNQQACGRGPCSALAGHEGSCADASGWGVEAWRGAWEHTDEQLQLALRREAHKSGLIDAARELVPLVRYHAMHAGVSPQDRARIAALCDEVEERRGG